MNSKIKFYPVGNGDQSLITLKDGTTIMVDCNIRTNSVGSTDPTIYDVKKDVLACIKRRDGNPFLDVFILTHGDCDHCRGFNTHFYQGDPKNYGKKNREVGEIIVDEMWFSPMIAEQHTNDDEDAYQTEAERRLELHRKEDPDRDLPGNRIKIVGYDNNTDYSDLNHLRALPGKVVSTFNNKGQDTFSLFIHAPFKEHLQSAEKDKNATSIVFQARFNEAGTAGTFTGLAMFGGDSDHYSWKVILEQTINHGNETALEWDIFLAPHHCSWSFFNDRPQSDHTDPTDTSLKVLGYRRLGGMVVASCKKILNDDDNPPHYEAKQKYLKKLEESTQFLNTAIEPKESAPEPLVFEITPGGIVKLRAESIINEEKLDAAISTASAGVIKKPWAS